MNPVIAIAKTILGKNGSPAWQKINNIAGFMGETKGHQNSANINKGV